MTQKRKSRVPSCLSRAKNSEKVISMNLLGNFNSQGSRGKNLIEEIVGFPLQQISRNGLIGIATVVGSLIHKDFPRNYSRKKDLIVKWFDDNCEQINKIKSFIIVKV